jgi:hypothetical protein
MTPDAFNDVTGGSQLHVNTSADNRSLADKIAELVAGEGLEPPTPGL